MTNTYTINPTINTTTGIGSLSGATGGGTISIGGGIGGVGPGQIYTTNGTGATNWATPSQTSFHGGNGKPVMSMPHGTDEVILEKDATLNVKGRLVINDRDLEERLDTIEKLLSIPERDNKLEKKHPKLKKLYDEYISALGKYRTFEAIKGEDE